MPIAQWPNCGPCSVGQHQNCLVWLVYGKVPCGCRNTNPAGHPDVPPKPGS